MSIAPKLWGDAARRGNFIPSARVSPVLSLDVEAISKYERSSSSSSGV